jgi:hypothetical protein
MRAAITILIMGLFLGCSGADKAPPRVLFVEQAQVIAVEDKPGWYMVTDGWLARRLEYEQQLQRALLDCAERCKEKTE